MIKRSYATTFTDFYTSLPPKTTISIKVQIFYLFHRFLKSVNLCRVLKLFTKIKINRKIPMPLLHDLNGRFQKRNTLFVKNRKYFHETSPHLRIEPSNIPSQKPSKKSSTFARLSDYTLLFSRRRMWVRQDNRSYRYVAPKLTHLLRSLGKSAQTGIIRTTRPRNAHLKQKQNVSLKKATQLCFEEQ